MAGPPAQNLQNHARYVPLYHFAAAGLVALYFLHATLEMAKHFSATTLDAFVLAVAMILLFFYARAFALAVQDRVIRLEMRQRMQSLAPDLMPRFDELTAEQVTALRFAGDGELRALAGQVLDGRLRRGADIKAQVKDWRADHWRA